ncbi:MAG TPA: PAS domain S-box protein [Terracidiphilus sp.]|nr:PAS domain S-box protein [Terracidiphilus sp.]
MDLSEYILEPLREDEDFILYRGRHRDLGPSERSSILLLAPSTPHPAFSMGTKAEHESSELGGASYVCPTGDAQYRWRPVLVLENAGGEILNALVQRAIDTGHPFRVAWEKALEHIERSNDRLDGENRVVRERVDQKAQLLSEQKRVAGEFDWRVAERTRGLVETNEDLQIQAGLLQHLPVSAWTLKPDGTPDFVNQVWLEFSGQTLDFVRSHPDAWMTVVHPEDRESVSKAFWDGVRSGHGFSFETRSLRARDGAYRWHLQQAVVLRDAEGRVLKFVGTTTDIHEQKLAEERVRASEANLRQVIDTIPTLSWCNLADGPNEFLSKSWHDYTGLSPEEAHGWGWSSAFHPDDLTPLMNRWQELLVSGESSEIEARLRRHDGVYRWFLIRVAPFRDKAGTILRWYGTSTDIHDRKLAEDELKRSEARYRVVIETASDAVVSVDESGTIILANPAANRMFGYNPEEFIGRNLNTLMPGRMREPFDTGFKRFLETGARNLNWQGTEATALRANGEEFPVEISFGDMTTNGRRVLTGFIRDTSEKKRAEEDVFASQRNLRLAIDTMPVLSWSALPDGTADFFNKRWLDYTGLSLEEARGQGWAQAFHPDDVERVSDHWRLHILSGEPGEVEARLRRFDGSYRWFLLRGNPLHDESGAIIKWYGTNTDIDDRKRAEEELTRARAELAHVARVTSLGVLTASIAHEVNQPLSGIVMNAGTCLRMLDSDPPNIEGARETARRMIRDGIRASEVVVRLRALFKRKEVAAEWVNLNDAALEVIALSSSELQSKRIVVQHELAENLPAVKGDRIQLQQVIQNLLRNASDSMGSIDDRPRELVIRTKSDDSKNVQVTVQDTGIGIDPEAASRLFDPFYTTKQDGTGIGLSVSRSIVEAHRGQIWAIKNDGPGSSFMFTIPCDSGSLQAQS